jgi:peptidoglycan/xylan/chitin deacetylase (PgdA/CDA1 family)
MSAEFSAYYSRLAPFRSIFEQGSPILTYHKLGPRPGRARLKGLYMSRALFTRQLVELREAGFTSGSLASANAKAEKQLIITFDDGYVNVLRHALEPLLRTKFTAIQFLPANLLGKCNEWDVSLGEAPEPIMDSGQVREWIAAGHQIGSHSLTHPYLTRIPPGEAYEEITASRKKLEDLFGMRIEHFCYPYGDWNHTVRDLVKAAGYLTACTTEPGMNTPSDSPFSLKRFTARYPSRSLKTIWSLLREAWILMLFSNCIQGATTPR